MDTQRGCILYTIVYLKSSDADLMRVSITECVLTINVLTPGIGINAGRAAMGQWVDEARRRFCGLHWWPAAFRVRLFRDAREAPTAMAAILYALLVQRLVH